MPRKAHVIHQHNLKHRDQCLTREWAKEQLVDAHAQKPIKIQERDVVDAQLDALEKNKSKLTKKKYDEDKEALEVSKAQKIAEIAAEDARIERFDPVNVDRNLFDLVKEFKDKSK